MKLLNNKIPLRLGSLSIADVTEYDAQSILKREQSEGQPSVLNNNGSGFRLHSVSPRHGIEKQLPQSCLASTWKHLPKHASQNVIRRQLEMSFGLSIEAPDTPQGVNRVEPFANAFEDRLEFVLGIGCTSSTAIRHAATCGER
jgi:hypothetical protein